MKTIAAARAAALGVALAIAAMAGFAFPAGPARAQAAAAAGDAATYTFTTGPITVEYPWTRQALAGLDALVFMTIRNSGEPDRLVGVESLVGFNAEPVDVVLTGNRFRMIPVGGIDVPTGTLELAGPDGNAVALRNVFSDLAIGGTVGLTLTFAKAGALTIEVLVEREDAVRHGYAPD